MDVRPIKVVVFGHFCLEQGIDFIALSEAGYPFLANILNGVGFWVKLLKQDIKNRTVFVLSTVRVSGAGPGRTSSPKDISSSPGMGRVKVISLP